ncbi:MAG: hypothetical protein EA371_10665 [Gammaproteobacteria bacterium]|nr:MAG: hypothetical protein EA371_10665 [Gammaproteobacteria bacterium]
MPADADCREGLLTARPTGYYREYTVSTPGARDPRYPRRAIAKPCWTYWPVHWRSRSGSVTTGTHLPNASVTCPGWRRRAICWWSRRPGSYTTNRLPPGTPQPKSWRKPARTGGRGTRPSGC